MIATHDFSRTTFNKPTYCSYCEKFIWGLVKQGYSCRKCHQPCHKGGCLAKLMATPCLGQNAKKDPLDAYLEALLNATPTAGAEASAEHHGASVKLAHQTPSTPEHRQEQLTQLTEDLEETALALERAKAEGQQLKEQQASLEAERVYLQFIVDQLEKSGYTG